MTYRGLDIHVDIQKKYITNENNNTIRVFIYLGFYVAFNTVQVISQRVVGRAEETSTYNWSSFCTVNCRPTVSNWSCATVAPTIRVRSTIIILLIIMSDIFFSVYV